MLKPYSLKGFDRVKLNWSNSLISEFVCKIVWSNPPNPLGE